VSLPDRSVRPTLPVRCRADLITWSGRLPTRRKTGVKRITKALSVSPPRIVASFTGCYYRP